MKRWFAAMALFLLLPALSAAEIAMTELADQESGSTLVVFEIKADETQQEGGAEPLPDFVRMALGAQIEVRFQQEKAMIAMGRAGAQIRQQGTLYQDEQIASLARTWQGEQADGRDGSSAAALTVNLETGMEIYLDELFSDYAGAVAAMEAIIERDIFEGMSGYLEYADLLPLPEDCYSVDEAGLTIYWPEDRYRYYSGESGSVTFYWHELSAYIGEDSPVYALSRAKELDADAIVQMVGRGSFDLAEDCMLGRKLEEIAYALADPDYTTDALVYPLERVRGYAVEIPKYAETDEENTPVSAVRASRIDACGLTTGITRAEDVLAVLGQPDMKRRYDGEAALNALLEPGESLLYALEDHVLEAHFDEGGLLSCLILRDAMPESLY